MLMKNETSVDDDVNFIIYEYNLLLYNLLFLIKVSNFEVKKMLKHETPSLRHDFVATSEFNDSRIDLVEVYTNHECFRCMHWEESAKKTIRCVIMITQTWLTVHRFQYIWLHRAQQRAHAQPISFRNNVKFYWIISNIFSIRIPRRLFSFNFVAFRFINFESERNRTKWRMKQTSGWTTQPIFTCVAALISALWLPILLRRCRARWAIFHNILPNFSSRTTKSERRKTNLTIEPDKKHRINRKRMNERNDGKGTEEEK